MRLIDADALEKAINEWMPKDQSTWMDSDIPPIENLIVSVMMTIQEQPTVDALPVVRCKDCKYYRKDGDCWHEWDNAGRIYYQSIINEPNPDDYCSRAKRIEE